MAKRHSKIKLIDATTLEIGGVRYHCHIGRGGIAPIGEKREGDLKTPSGRFFLRACYYRPDRIERPTTGLPVIALTPQDGWCDDATHALYNQHITLPFAARHEVLWRDDHVYDIIIPLGYNDGVDTRITAGAGSAIFMHLMREDGEGTEGCVALKRNDLLALLPQFTPSTFVEIG